MNLSVAIYHDIRRFPVSQEAWPAWIDWIIGVGFALLFLVVVGVAVYEYRRAGRGEK